MTKEPRQGLALSPETGIPIRLLMLLGALVALGPLATDAYVPGLPVIASDLHENPAIVQFGVTACLLCLALGQIVAGPWGDRVGRRAVILVGVTGFAAGAWITAASSNGIIFVVALALQGLGGSFALVSANAVVRDRASGTAAARAFSALLLVTGLAPIVAPIIGTALLATSSWRTIFIVTGAISAALAVAVAVALPRQKRPVMKQAAGPAWRAIFLDRSFITLALGNALIFGAMFVYITGGPFFLRDGFGLTEVQFGIVFAVNAIGLSVTAQVSGRTVNRIGIPTLLSVGACVSVAGGVLLVLGTHIGGGMLPVILVGLFLLVASIGLILPYATAAALEPHGANVGTATAVFGASQYLFGAAGAAIAGAVTTATGQGLSLTILILAATGAAALLGATLPRMRRTTQPSIHPNQ